MAVLAGALVIPSPPLLLPEYAGQSDPGAALRDRIVAALVDELARLRPGGVVVVTGHERAPRHARGAVGARVADLALRRAGWTGPTAHVVLPFDADARLVRATAASIHGAGSPGGGPRDATGAGPRDATCAGPGDASVGAESRLLLVAADGSAKRTEKAPGHYDERATPLDSELIDALGSGDAGALIALEPTVCADLWCTGRAALQVLAELIPAPAEAEVLWADAPYGVQYVLARWRA